MDRLKPLFYEFENFRVDTERRLLWRDGEQIPLTPKVFDTLLVFLEHRGELLEKDRLMELLWSDSFVEESNLAQNVAVLRRALGEKSREHRFIITIPGHGYRFVADVRESGAAAAKNGNQPRPASVQTGPSTPSDSSGKRTRTGLIITLGLVGVLISGLVGYWLRPGSPVAGEPTAIARTQQLTTWSGLDFYPSVSRDGNLVAFCSDRTGSFQIYIKQLISGSQEIQLTNDDGQNFQPAISPNGSLIAFHSKKKSGIWVIPATGGRARQITQFGTNPDWSPDGTTIAFQSDPLNDLGSGFRNAMPPSTIWIVEAGGGEPRRLTQIGDPPGGHGSPTWSPDGERIFFDASDQVASSVWSVATDGGDLKRIAPRMASEAAISADGRQLYFVEASGMGVKRQELDANGEPVGEQQKIFDASGVRIRQIAVSGNKIIYAAISTESNLSAMRIGEDGNPVSEPVQLTQTTHTRSVMPAFSPDGNKIAFVFLSFGSASTIWIANADGSDKRELTPGFNPWWFPDGETIGYSWGSSGASGFFTIPLDGSIESEHFKYPDPESVAGRISPDGKIVAFNSKQSGTINIWTMPVNGGDTTQLTFDQEMAGFPAWSPDGKWLAVQLKRGENTHVAVIPAVGGKAMQLTSDAGQSWVYDWTPDSDKVVFAGQRDGIWNVYTVSQTSGKIEKITNYDKQTIYVRYPAWSPKNDVVAYEYAETTGNIWMMELK